ncbi:acyl carrier protein [Paratractidigestivibacter sp.]|jgi:acyl carrier protein|uniref:acyl carrier protein n=1 Tax=Atopobiaceae TaxID=1643824 RepID=UPI000D7908FD|nr:MAG: phosphopantetheine-binding protein [Coriobacteriia bacterium]
MERKEILEQVIQVVGETLDVADGVELTEDTNLKELGADSFDLLELVTALEDEFGLTLDDDDVEKIATIGQVVDAIKNAE